MSEFSQFARQPIGCRSALLLAAIGAALGMSLVVLLPATSSIARFALAAGSIAGLVYAAVYWRERLGAISQRASILTLSGLVVLPSTALALVRVPYGVAMYSAGFVIASTGGLWLGTVVYRLARDMQR